MNWFLALISVFILFFSLLKNNRKGTLLSPASLFTAFISILLFFALVFEDGAYGYVGYLWLIASIVVINLGSIVGAKMFLPHARTRTFVLDKVIIGKILLWGTFLLFIIAAYNYVTSGGMSGASQNAYDYYTSGYKESSGSFLDNVVNQVLGISSMLISFLGGVYFILETRKRRYLAFATFLYSIINMLYSTQKLGIILAFFYFVIGIIICYLYLGKRIKMRDLWNAVKKYWIIIIAIPALFILSFMLRFGQFNAYYLGESFNKLKTYAFGGMQCFNAWLSTWSQDTYKLGLESFMGIPHALGLVERVAGLYEVMYKVGVGTTNIFTAFRPLIIDYGVFGSLIFLFVISFIGRMSFNTFYRFKTNASFLILSILYLYFLYSPITSPYIYLNVSITFIFYVICFKIFSHLFGKRKVIRRKIVRRVVVITE